MEPVAYNPMGVPGRPAGLPHWRATFTGLGIPDWYLSAAEKPSAGQVIADMAELGAVAAAASPEALAGALGVRLAYSTDRWTMQFLLQAWGRGGAAVAAAAETAAAVQVPPLGHRKPVPSAPVVRGPGPSPAPPGVPRGPGPSHTPPGVPPTPPGVPRGPGPSPAPPGVPRSPVEVVPPKRAPTFEF